MLKRSSLMFGTLGLLLMVVYLSLNANSKFAKANNAAVVSISGVTNTDDPFVFNWNWVQVTLLLRSLFLIQLTRIMREDI